MQPINKPAIKQRLLSNISKDTKTKCWNWLGCRDDKGYARLKINYKSERAHRLSYHIFTSDVKAYEVVHHTCSNKSCINPKHLRLVSPQENTAEMLERRHYHKQIAELQQEVERLQKDRCKCQSQ
jgi:hypothetical protein